MFSSGVIANRLRYPFEVAAPADLVVAADRATLSDAGIAFAAVDKANLSAAGATTIDPAYGRKRYGVWVNMTTAPTTTPQEILGLGSRFSLFLSGDGAPIGSAKVIIAAISEEPQEAGVISINQWVFLEVESWAEDSGMGDLDILARARINAGTWSDISVNQETVEVEPVSTPLKIGINFNGRMDSAFVADENVSNFYNAGSGFTFSQVPQNQTADLFHWWDFSARSPAGVWFDAVGGANLIEEFDATSSATKLNLTTGITAGLGKAYGTDVGDSVSLWLDRSGKGNDLAQTAIVSQPMLVKVNGNEWIKFDGVDDRLTGSPVIIDHTSDFLYVLVFRTGSSVAGLQVIFQNRIDNSNRFAINVSNGVVHARDGVGNFPQSNSVTTNTTYVLTYNLSSGVPTMHLNGLTGGNASVHTSLGDVLAIGSRGDGASPFSGFVGDLLIAPRAISTTERIRIERSLAAKYGITLA
jgi:hypothetical protein